jgi:hypothetical protein
MYAHAKAVEARADIDGSHAEYQAAERAFAALVAQLTDSEGL